MRQIAIFYNVYCVQNWLEIAIDQTQKIGRSGLYKAASVIYCKVTGSPKQFTQFCKLVENNPKFVPERIEYNAYEYPAIRALWEFSQETGPDAFNVLYLHTKGVTCQIDQRDKLKSCRDCLEYFNVERWRDCVELLDSTDYDTCGIQLIRENQNWRFYSCNYWWSKSSYIVNLPPPFRSENRSVYEWWLIDHNPFVKPFSFFDRIGHHFNEGVDPSLYREFPSELPINELCEDNHHSGGLDDRIKKPGFLGPG